MSDTTSTEAKIWLQRYKWSVEQILRADEAIRSIKDMQTNCSPNMSGLPPAHHGSDMSVFAAKLDEEERRKQSLIEQSLRVRQEILTSIDEIAEPDAVKRVLTLRYINLANWAEIQSRLKISERWMFDLHLRGIQAVQRNSGGSKEFKNYFANGAQ